MSEILRKSVLRKELNNILNNLSSAEILRQSEVVLKKLLATPQYESARSISVYLSMDKEIQTDQLVHHILTNDKECFIPRFQTGCSEMEMIQLKSIEDFQNLPRNKWNIRQPSDDDCRNSVFDNGALDLVIVPGLGFTAGGKRLGRGKGYYDKFLERCEKEFKKRPITIGVAFSQQVISDIPTTLHDKQIDHVISADFPMN